MRQRRLVCGDRCVEFLQPEFWEVGCRKGLAFCVSSCTQMPCLPRQRRRVVDSEETVREVR